MKNAKWNLLMLCAEIDASLTALIVFLLIVLTVCFIASYGMSFAEHSWQEKEAAKWAQEHHRRAP